MPDESCRSCGGELVKYVWCSKCRKTIQKICKNCITVTLFQFHIACSYHRYFEQKTIQIAIPN